jgi:cytochrome P450
LSTPVQTREGKVNSLFIGEGTTITVSLKAINRSEAFWGADAKEFKPERWLNEDGLADAKEIQGHRHLLTFSDGPRICLGKGFALAEFKVAFDVHTHTHNNSHVLS